MSQTKKLIPLFKSVVDVISDFLESLKQHTMETLTRKFGKEFLDLTPIDWILAVPAVWSDSTKALMMKAAVAGLGKNASIKLISEPDAAAVCALSDLQPNHLKVMPTLPPPPGKYNSLNLARLMMRLLSPTAGAGRSI